MSAIRPLVRELSIVFYRWAQHDLQHKNPHHPDLLVIVHKLRDLYAEREASDSIYRKAIRWL
jgi:hypothetical protein